STVRVVRRIAFSRSLGRELDDWDAAGLLEPRLRLPALEKPGRNLCGHRVLQGAEDCMWSRLAVGIAGPRGARRGIMNTARRSFGCRASLIGDTEWLRSDGVRLFEAAPFHDSSHSRRPKTGESSAREGMIRARRDRPPAAAHALQRGVEGVRLAP